MISIPDSIFPKDSNGRPICQRCKKIIQECICSSGETAKLKPTKLNPMIRLEKSGRKGKMVTMIEGLPRNETMLKNMATELKSKTGSGGTFYFNERGGAIEIQGDHQQTIKQIFLDKQ